MKSRQGTLTTWRSGRLGNDKSSLVQEKICPGALITKPEMQSKSAETNSTMDLENTISPWAKGVYTERDGPAVQ